MYIITQWLIFFLRNQPLPENYSTFPVIPPYTQQCFVASLFMCQYDRLTLEPNHSTLQSSLESVTSSKKHGVEVNCDLNLYNLQSIELKHDLLKLMSIINITLCFCVRGSQLMLTALMGPNGQNAVFRVSSLTLTEIVPISIYSFLWKILHFHAWKYV